MTLTAPRVGSGSKEIMRGTPTAAGGIDCHVHCNCANVVLGILASDVEICT